MRPIDVGVVGAGTAGSAAAIFLARAGHRVTLYERVKTPGPIGAGITLQPTGLHVLARLGVAPEILARGARITRLFCQTRARRPLVDLSYETIDAKAFGLGVHRGVLFEALFDAVRREPVTLETGVETTSLWHDDSPRSGGRRTWLVDAQNQRHGPHDLIVVADGARSQLRDRARMSKRVSAYPWGALWFVGRETRDAATTTVLHQITDGNHRFLGLLPTGHGALRDPGPRLVSLFWSQRCNRVDAWKGRGLAAWKNELVSLAPEASGVVEQIESIEQVLFATYYDVAMPRWASRNVVFLGDAAHATSPQLGQGANLALWDAMVLADSIATEKHDLARALDTYCRARSEHLKFYQWATRLLTPFFQGDQPLLGGLRDLTMPLLCKIPITNRLMTRCMLGVVDGFTGRLLDIPT